MNKNIFILMLILSIQNLNAQDNDPIESAVHKELHMILNDNIIDYPFVSDNDIDIAKTRFKPFTEKMINNEPNPACQPLVNRGKFPQAIFYLFKKEKSIQADYSMKKRSLPWYQRMFLEVGYHLFPQAVTQPQEIKAVRRNINVACPDNSKIKLLDKFATLQWENLGEGMSASVDSRLGERLGLVQRYWAKNYNDANQAIDKHESKDAYILRGQCISAVAVTLGVCAWMSSKKK